MSIIIRYGWAIYLNYLVYHEVGALSKSLSCGIHWTDDIDCRSDHCVLMVIVIEILGGACILDNDRWTFSTQEWGGWFGFNDDQSVKILYITIFVFLLILLEGLIFRGNLITAFYNCILAICVQYVSSGDSIW